MSIGVSACLQLTVHVVLQSSNNEDLLSGSYMSTVLLDGLGSYIASITFSEHNNTSKIKIMVVDKNRTDDRKFILNGEELEEVKSFVYIGSLINTEVSCMPEVNRILCTIENMTTIWKSLSICKSLKLRIDRATAFAFATYGCESWAYSKKVTKEIEARK